MSLAKRRLLAKLSGTFGLFVLVIVTAVGGLVSLSVKAKYSKIVRDSDVSMAEGMTHVLSEYYTTTGSWNGVARFFTSLPQYRMLSRRGMAGQMMTPGRGGVPMLIEDQNGHTVFDSRPGPSLLRRDGLSGATIWSADKPVGNVYVGSMLGVPLTPEDRAVIRSINVSVFMYAFGAAVIALGLGAFIAVRIERPVRSLAAAATRVAEGDLTARVAIKENDEIGILGQRFNHMAESLEQADQFRKMLIADTAHELRTPVSLLQGRLELMADGIYPLDKDGIERLLDETKAITRLISDMRFLADAEAGTMQLSLETADMSEIAATCVELFTPMAEEQSVTLQLSVSPDIPQTLLDKSKVRQVFSNLIANAIAYSPPQSEVLVQIEIDSANIVSRVIDHGTGIPDELRNRLFERFSKVGGTGSGLGLAISREIAKLLNGVLQLESSGSEGSVFTLKIPLSPPPD